MDDLISRQALLEEYDRLHVGKPGRARKMIEDAPSAQPEPCGEMVSREVVVKFFDDWMSALDINCHHQSVADLRIIKGDIKNLPSAQPAQTDCEYCHEDFDGYVLPIEKNSHAWLIRRGRTMKLRIGFKGEYRECDILFCPMCGRRLTDG